jgi:hypothetical protein
MKPCPNSLKESLSRAISGTTRALLVALKLVDNLTNVLRTESALAANVLNHGLTGRSLSKAANRSWKVLAETWVASTVFAADSNEANLASFVATNAIGVCEVTGLHLCHGDQESIRDKMTVLMLYEHAVSDHAVEI